MALSASYRAGSTVLYSFWRSLGATTKKVENTKQPMHLMRSRMSPISRSNLF